MTPPSGLLIELAELTAADLHRAGGKAVSLGRLSRAGLPVPPGACITTKAYDSYLDNTGLRQRLPLLLERKLFSDMRWEELWDLGLRVRSLFLNTPIPAGLAAELTGLLAPRFAELPVTVRSTAPVEDSATASFAGLHDSFVNVRGLPAILDRLRLVWASLWSDRALLYRKELGLDPTESAMAVIIQELVVGDCSGVAFSRCPGREELAVVEAVWGLNQGLVDGDVEPDRLLLDPTTGRVVDRHAPVRKSACRTVEGGVTLAPLSPAEREMTPLPDSAACRVLDLLRQAEALFGTPQDLEWTLRSDELFALQSRPITTSNQTAGGDERVWYLTLHRSMASLKELRQTIEGELLPAMAADAARMASLHLAALDDRTLAEAICERQAVLAGWETRYREICIPMAHGIRLFGQIYNDRLRPGDPFAFLDLLAGDSGLLAVQRNRALLDLARQLRDDPNVADRLREGGVPDPASPFAAALSEFTGHFGDLSWVMGGRSVGEHGVAALLLELASAPTAAPSVPRQNDEAAFLASFPEGEQGFARELLEIGRASYRLRDNDNLYIGRLTERLQEARDEAVTRLAVRDIPELAALIAPHRERVVKRLTPAMPADKKHRPVPGMRLQPRQLVGQPAGPGLAMGPARVISQPADLALFKAGEILVCDAVDPNMTFVIPLAGGIVERRGGMLIHGAIIAREYGLPCVTGVPDATRLIRSGELLTVDGYLGLAIIATELGRKGRS
jgi:pyruvate,water dikinase